MNYDYFYMCREGSKKMKQNFLKIPINRILALILLDIMSIVVASFAALYIRFDFSFEGIPQEYLIKFENIIVYNIILTLLFFALWKLYKSLCQRDRTVEYCIRYYLRQYSTDDPVPYPESEDAP